MIIILYWLLIQKQELKFKVYYNKNTVDKCQ